MNIASDPRSAVLLLGAGGPLAPHVLRALLEQSPRPLLVAVDEQRRPPDLPHAPSGRVRFVDPRDDALLLDRAAALVVCPAGVGGPAPDVVVDLATALAEFGSLRQVVHVSTLAVQGDAPGTFAEDDLDVGQRHHTRESRLAFETERALRDVAVPVTVLRAAPVIGHSETGWVPAVAGALAPLAGLVHEALAGGSPPTTPVEFVPADVVGRCVVDVLGVELAACPRIASTLHVISGRRALRIGDVLDVLRGAGIRVPRAVAAVPTVHRPVGGARARALLPPRPPVDLRAALGTSLRFAQARGWDGHPPDGHAAPSVQAAGAAHHGVRRRNRQHAALS